MRGISLRGHYMESVENMISRVEVKFLDAMLVSFQDFSGYNKIK